jgi:hypothetical protein
MVRNPDTVYGTVGCFSICSQQSAILASPIINRASGARFRSTSIAAVGVNFIAPVIARKAIL